jgi:hypothetical protein
MNANTVPDRAKIYEGSCAAIRSQSAPICEGSDERSSSSSAGRRADCGSHVRSLARLTARPISRSRNRPTVRTDIRRCCTTRDAARNARSLAQTIQARSKERRIVRSEENMAGLGCRARAIARVSSPVLPDCLIDGFIWTRVCPCSVATLRRLMKILMKRSVGADPAARLPRPCLSVVGPGLTSLGEAQTGNIRMAEFASRKCDN